MASLRPGRNAGIKLTGMHSTDFQDPIGHSDSGDAFTQPTHAADMRRLFGYACMLATRRFTNAAASLAAFYMLRTGAHGEVAYILNICLINGWPEPRSPAQPETPRGCGHAVHASQHPIQASHSSECARLHDQAFIEDMVAFIATERWLRGNAFAAAEFLVVLVNSHSFSKAVFRDIREGLLYGLLYP